MSQLNDLEAVRQARKRSNSLVSRGERAGIQAVSFKGGNNLSLNQGGTNKQYRGKQAGSLSVSECK